MNNYAISEVQVIDIYNVDTWPPEILDYLKKFHDLFEQKSLLSETYEQAAKHAAEYDNFIKGLSPLLSPYSLHGYHCTRLTQQEINIITSRGMLLPNLDTMRARIQTLISDNIISIDIAKLLLANNQCDDNFRKNKIWFCFFLPYLAGRGIIRFFKSWGGEALYNSHETNIVTGPVLSAIGVPCIIEAYVPLLDMPKYDFEIRFANRYMANQGLEEIQAQYYEGYTCLNIPQKNIISIAKYPEKKFFDLSHYNTQDILLL